MSCLGAVAHGLHKIQSTFGVIPNLKSKGVAAKKVLEKMLHFRVEEEESMEKMLPHGHDNFRIRPEIDTMLV